MAGRKGLNAYRKFLMDEEEEIEASIRKSISTGKP